MSGTTSIAVAPRRLSDLLPGTIAALSYSTADVLGKVVFNDGMDVLSFLTSRGVLVVAVFWLWLRASPPRIRHTRRERAISLGVGAIFAVNMFALMLAIQLLPLSLAILTYFIYPLLTGIAGAATGIDRIGWRGMIAALAAFFGLALMLQTRIGDVAMLGVAAALLAAVLRVVSLLITRAYLARTDSRLNTWYSLVPSTAMFVVLSATTQTLNLPHSSIGWIGLLGMSFTTTLSVLAIFISTARIGAFRTALIMNLEPLVSTLASMALLGEVLEPLQALGGAIMLAALCAFQLRR